MKTASHASSTVWFCAFLLAAFHAGVLLLPFPRAPMAGYPAPARQRWPTLRMQTQAVRVDVAELRRSLLRLPATALLRQISNSLRLTFGEFPAWMFYAHHQSPTFFLHDDLLLAPGLTPGNREVVDQAVASISGLNRRFAAENWKMVVLPVPTKLSVYSKRADWPLLESDRLTKMPIAQDRTDEVCDDLFNRLAKAGVTAVDLRGAYRAVVDARDGKFVFPPGESHWSGLGLTIAADRVASALGTLGLPATGPAAPLASYRLHEDINSGLDHLYFWPPGLRRLSGCTDLVEIGDKLPAPAEKLQALVAISGTSYTGQYSWAGSAGLAASLDCRLPTAVVRSFAEAGRGSLKTVQAFIDQKSALLREIASGNGTTQNVKFDQKYFVWEFPLRDLRGFQDAPKWTSSEDAPLVHNNPPLVITYGDGFYRQETNEGVLFRWAKRRATMHVRVAAAGRFRMGVRPLTVFSKIQTAVAITVNGVSSGKVSTSTCDFHHAAEQSPEMSLDEGDNTIELQADQSEVFFGAADGRSPAFALLMPISIHAEP